MIYGHTVNTPQTYHSQHITYHQKNWGNRYGNGYTAMNWARHWYQGWTPYYYRWHNHHWVVYLRHGHSYRTVYISSNYGQHYYRSGYIW